MVCYYPQVLLVVVIRKHIATTTIRQPVCAQVASKQTTEKGTTDATNINNDPSQGIDGGILLDVGELGLIVSCEENLPIWQAFF